MGSEPDDPGSRPPSPTASTGLRPLLDGLTLPEANGEAAIVDKLKGIVASPAERDPAVGDEFAGRYRLLRELGRGGMGVVWEGEDIELGRRVAIKMITGRVDPSGLAPHASGGSGRGQARAPPTSRRSTTSMWTPTRPTS